MESEQRTEREITYHVGWKRGKIALNQGKAAPGEPSLEVEKAGASQPFIGHVWNERWVWKKARVLPGTWLIPLLYALPVATFGLSLWLVYVISNQP